MTEYKSDRQVFVDSLKVGDKAAARTRRLDTNWGYPTYGFQVLTVTKISPSRAKITVLDPDSGEMVFNKYGNCQVGTGRYSTAFYLEPVTVDILQSIRTDTIRGVASSRKWRLISKLNEIRDSFEEKDEHFHQEFCAASDQLMALLDKHTTPKK
jgi:hypothetical protein